MGKRRRMAVVALSLLGVSHAEEPTARKNPAVKIVAVDTVAGAPAAAWPGRGVDLVPPPLVVPEDAEKRVVFVNAGHGAERNSGSLSLTCSWEMDHNRMVQDELAVYLDATGLFEVVRGRPTPARTSYQSRLDAMARARAEVLVEIHADVRDGGEIWEPEPGLQCVRNLGDPGFSVLVNDSATGPLLERRLALARTVSKKLKHAGFLDYDGSDYIGNYQPDSQPGVWLDRRGLMMLRKPTVPSIIIETHNHQNPDEVARWSERPVRDAFYGSVAASLAAYFAEEPQ